MFQYVEKTLSRHTFHFQIKRAGALLSVGDVLELWQTSTVFRSFYNKILEEVPFFGFFWENKPFANVLLEEPYEFVIVGTEVFNGLKTEREAFEEHFEKGEWVVHFDNLDKDAQLIVPCPTELYSEGYRHLGQFIRNAPDAQRQAFWKCVGHQTQLHLKKKEQPVWLSTSGLGVHWLHVRLDERPKYYIHNPYKQLD